MALDANRLGKQYVFLNDDVLKHKLKIKERLYFCEEEKETIKNRKLEESEIGKNKVKLVMYKYAVKGIDSSLNNLNLLRKIYREHKKSNVFFLIYLRRKRIIFAKNHIFCEIVGCHGSFCMLFSMNSFYFCWLHD